MYYIVGIYALISIENIVKTEIEWPRSLFNKYFKVNPYYSYLNKYGTLNFFLVETNHTVHADSFFILKEKNPRGFLAVCEFIEPLPNCII